MISRFPCHYAGKFGVCYKKNQLIFRDVEGTMSDIGQLTTGESYFVSFDYLSNRESNKISIEKETDLEILTELPSKSASSPKGGSQPQSSGIGGGMPAMLGDTFGLALFSQRDISMVLLYYNDEGFDFPILSSQGDDCYFLSYAATAKNEKVPFKIVKRSALQWLHSKSFMPFGGSSDSKSGSVAETPFGRPKKGRAPSTGMSGATSCGKESDISAIGMSSSSPCGAMSAISNRSDVTALQIFSPAEQINLTLKPTAKAAKKADTAAAVPPIAAPLVSFSCEAVRYRVQGPSALTEHLLDPTMGLKRGIASSPLVRQTSEKSTSSSSSSGSTSPGTWTSFQECYSVLKSVGWHYENWPPHEKTRVPMLEDGTVYLIPKFNKTPVKDRIENLEFFHTKAALMEHINSHECYSVNGEEFAELLAQAGWVQTSVSVGKSDSRMAYVFEAALNAKPNTLDLVMLQRAQALVSETDLSIWCEGEQGHVEGLSALLKATKGLIPGVHMFSSKRCMTQYISKFPFLLLSDSLFEAFLLKQQWTRCKAGKWGMGSLSPIPLKLTTVRRLAWLCPSILFMFSTPTVPAVRLLDAIRVSITAALTLLDESSPEKVVKCTTKIPARAAAAPVVADEISPKSSSKVSARVIVVEETSPEKATKSSSKISARKLHFCDSINQLDITGSLSQLSQSSAHSDDDEEEGEGRESVKALVKMLRRTTESDDDEAVREDLLSRLLAALGARGWQKVHADWSSEWWSRLLVILAPWSPKKKEKLVGVDFFFDLGDVIAYVTEFGCRRVPDSSITLNQDFTDSSWDRDRYLQHSMDELGRGLCSINLNLLQDSGWSELTEGPVKLFIPYWSDRNNALDDKSSCKDGVDYFSTAESVVAYIQKYGNARRGSPGKSSKRQGAPLTKASKQRDAKEDSCTDEEMIEANEDVKVLFESIADSDSTYYLFAKVWDIAKRVGWRVKVITVNDIEREYYVPPWAIVGFKEVVKVKSKFNRCYFESKDSVLKFIYKYGFSAEPPSNSATPVKFEIVPSKRANGLASTVEQSFFEYYLDHIDFLRAKEKEEKDRERSARKEGGPKQVKKKEKKVGSCASPPRKEVPIRIKSPIDADAVASLSRVFDEYAVQKSFYPYPRVWSALEASGWKAVKHTNILGMELEYWIPSWNLDRILPASNSTEVNLEGMVLNRDYFEQKDHLLIYAHQQCYSTSASNFPQLPIDKRSRFPTTFQQYFDKFHDVATSADLFQDGLRPGNAPQKHRHEPKDKFSRTWSQSCGGTEAAAEATAEVDEPDEGFMMEWTALHQAATRRKRKLNLSSFNDVWKICHSEGEAGWKIIYLNGSTFYCRNPRITKGKDLPLLVENQDYFKSKDAFLQFVYKQARLHGADPESLIKAAENAVSDNDSDSEESDDDKLASPSDVVVMHSRAPLKSLVGTKDFPEDFYIRKLAESIHQNGGSDTPVLGGAAVKAEAEGMMSPNSLEFSPSKGSQDSDSSSDNEAEEEEEEGDQIAILLRQANPTFSRILTILRSQHGWTWAYPTKINGEALPVDVDSIYLRPGRSLQDMHLVRGEDYFLREQEVIAYLRAAYGQNQQYESGSKMPRRTRKGTVLGPQIDGEDVKEEDEEDKDDVEADADYVQPSSKLLKRKRDSSDSPVLSRRNSTRVASQVIEVDSDSGASSEEDSDDSDVSDRPLEEVLIKYLKKKSPVFAAITSVLYAFPQPWSYDYVPKHIDNPSNEVWMYLTPGYTKNSPNMEKNVHYFLNPDALVHYLRQLYGIPTVYNSNSKRGRQTRRGTTLGPQAAAAARPAPKQAVDQPKKRKSSSLITSNQASKATTATVNATATEASSKRRAVEAEVSDAVVDSRPAGPVSLRESIRLATEALRPGARPIPNNTRATEYAHIKEILASSISACQGRSVYVCGSPGMGKSMVVKTVVSDIHRDLLADGSNVTVVQLQGTAMHGDVMWKEIATQMKLDCQRSNADCKTLVLNRLKASASPSSSRAKRVPMTLMFIDEVDKAPKEEVKELMLIASMSKFSGDASDGDDEAEEDEVDSAAAAASAQGDIRSSLVLITAANSFIFTSELNLPMSAEPINVVFEAYSLEALRVVLGDRVFGLFDAFALDMVIKKTALKSGDVRSALDLASKCLTAAVDELLTKESAFPAALPADYLLDEPTKVIVNLKIVSVVSGKLGIGAVAKWATLVAELSPHSRFLLVSLILGGMENQHRTMRQMAHMFNTYLAMRRLPDESLNQVSLYIDELLFIGALEGGPSHLGGNRNRLAEIEKAEYKLVVGADKLLQCPALEMMHTAPLNEYIANRKATD